MRSAGSRGLIPAPPKVWCASRALPRGDWATEGRRGCENEDRAREGIRLPGRQHVRSWGRDRQEGQDRQDCDEPPSCPSRPSCHGIAFHVTGLEALFAEFQANGLGKKLSAF